jgi:competence protein ComEA
MDLSRGQKLIIIGGLLALLAGIVILSLGRLVGQPSAVVYEAPPARSATPSQPIAVHVVGAVVNPGVYWLQPGRRVAEAIALAGGMTGQASAKSVNLAALVEDGQQIVVGTIPPIDSGLQDQQPAPPPAAAPAPAPPAEPQSSPTAPGATAAPGSRVVFPLSLNQATKEQLETIPEIGPELAQRILYYRYEHGGFRAVEELAKVPGIGEHRMGLLRQYVTP